MTPRQSPTTAVPVAGGRVCEHPDRADIRLEAVLHALSDPMRLRVVRTLAARGVEAACSEVELPVGKSTCTHHFRVLREAGVISQTYRGTSKMNALRRADLEALVPGLLDAVLAAADRQDGRLGGPAGVVRA
jgi:DNA-binding transcriptional ArsR family regulator